MNIRTVVFDLDGTLVDTAPDLVATLNVIFSREGLPPVDYADARNMVGGGARAMIERGLAAEGRTVSPPQLDRLVRDFIDYYAVHIADGSRPFAGVRAVLDELAKGGVRLAVCTNKLEWLSVRLLDRFGLSQCFAAICGADTFGVSKPNPLILRKAIEQAGGHAGRAVMVGDSGTDVATARAAGIPVIGVDFGYSDPPVAQLKPDRLVSRFADLPQVLQELFDSDLAEFAGRG